MPVHRELTYDAKTVGRRIRERREQREMKQPELAEAAGVSIAYVSRLEGGTRQASDYVLAAIAERLGTSAHWLITGEPDTVDMALEAGGLDPQSLTTEERNLLEHDIQEATFKAAHGAATSIRRMRNEAARAALEAERQALEAAMP